MTDDMKVMSVDSKGMVDVKLGGVAVEHQKPDDMRLCKYSLTLEAWVWSIILSPYYILSSKKYINACLALSLFRLGWVPLAIIGYVYLGSLPSSSGVTSDFLLLLWLMLIGLGCVAWIHLGTSYWWSNEVTYIKSKWLWK